MTIQISKIQLRRGLQTDLPGGPGSVSSGLDVGEIAFTTDTNRVFVGSDPSPTGTSALVSRIHDAQAGVIQSDGAPSGGYPFSNVEILTEFSPANQTVFDTKARNITSAYLVSTVMAISAPWQPVMVLQISSFHSPPEPLPFLINAQSPAGRFATAQISYHILDQANANMPLRAGRLTLFHQGNAFRPSLCDDAVGNPYAATPNGGVPIDPNERYGAIMFQAETTANGIELQYKIAITGANPPQPVMYFRIEQPVPQPIAMPLGPPICNAGANAIITACELLPYDVVGELLDGLYDGEVLFRVVFARPVAFLAGLPNSQAVCGSAATNAVSLSISINDTPVGAINFAAGALRATFACVGFTTQAGDIMTLTGPSPADASLAILSYTLSGTVAGPSYGCIGAGLSPGSGRVSTLRFVSGDVQTQGTPDVSFPTQLTISLWACFANPDQTLSFTGAGAVEFMTALWVNPNQFGFSASAFNGTFTASDGALRPNPVHVLFSIDFAAQVYCLYWNDVARPEDSSQVVGGPGDVLNDGGWSVSNPGGVADIWIDERYVDFTDVANRRKFIAEDGTPVDLGANGDLPFGASPRHFLHLSSSDLPIRFADNLGYAGPWEVAGDPLTLDTNCTPAPP